MSNFNDAMVQFWQMRCEGEIKARKARDEAEAFLIRALEFKYNFEELPELSPLLRDGVTFAASEDVDYANVDLGLPCRDEYDNSKKAVSARIASRRKVYGEENINKLLRHHSRKVVSKVSPQRLAEIFDMHDEYVTNKNTNTEKKQSVSEVKVFGSEVDMRRGWLNRLFPKEWSVLTKDEKGTINSRTRIILGDDLEWNEGTKEKSRRRLLELRAIMLKKEPSKNPLRGLVYTTMGWWRTDGAQSRV